MRFILFDAVGTLLTPCPTFVEVYHEVGREYGSQRTPAEIASRFVEAYRQVHQLPAGLTEGRPTTGSPSSDSLERLPTSEAVEFTRWRQIVSHVFHDVGDGIEDLFLRLWGHFADHASWRLYPDVAPALERLEAAGRPWGIASNFDSRLERICAGWPVLARAREIFYSSALGYSKPDPRFFAEIARRLGRAPAELLLVGDDPLNDCAGASAAGWHVIPLVRDARSSPGSYSTAPLATLDELFDHPLGPGSLGHH